MSTEVIFPHADGLGRTIIRGEATVERWAAPEAPGSVAVRKDDLVYTGDLFYEKDGEFFHARTGKQIYLMNSHGSATKI